jgi:hypothetical protein
VILFRLIAPTSWPGPDTHASLGSSDSVVWVMTIDRGHTQDVTLFALGRHVYPLKQGIFGVTWGIENKGTAC